MKPRRVLVLMHEDLVPPDSIEGLTEEEVFPWKMEWDVIRALKQLGHEVHPLGVGDELIAIRRAIEEFKPHIAFNLLRHFHGVPGYDANVVSFLELLRTPYTGANPRGLILANDKSLTKKILTYHRIPVPHFMVCRTGRPVRIKKGLDFPLIVKTVDEHASMGIAQASIVNDLDALKERVEFVHRSFGPEALVEEYIEGRELTVSVLGNTRLSTFPVWEMTFDNLPDRAEPIATARLKRDIKYQEKVGCMTGPAQDLPEGAGAKIARLAKRIFRALDQSGYGRIDLRLREDGRLRVLEANPNPDLCDGEDLAASAAETGIDYSGLIQRILNLGLRYAAPWTRY